MLQSKTMRFSRDTGKFISLSAATMRARPHRARSCWRTAGCWEPSMEYVCDRWHLNWKQRQLDGALREIEAYRQIVSRAYAEAP
jgi:hypothetical protein